MVGGLKELYLCHHCERKKMFMPDAGREIGFYKIKGREYCYDCIILIAHVGVDL